MTCILLLSPVLWFLSCWIFYNSVLHHSLFQHLPFPFRQCLAIFCVFPCLLPNLKKILPQSLLSETSDFFETASFTSGLKNGEKYMYAAGRISPSWKCFISAVTYYPIVLKPKIQYNEVWLTLCFSTWHANLEVVVVSLGFGCRR